LGLSQRGNRALGILVLSQRRNSAFGIRDGKGCHPASEYLLHLFLELSLRIRITDHRRRRLDAVQRRLDAVRRRQALPWRFVRKCAQVEP
jgi:hypothetical protein